MNPVYARKPPVTLMLLSWLTLQDWLWVSLPFDQKFPAVHKTLTVRCCTSKADPWLHIESKPTIYQVIVVDKHHIAYHI